MGSKKRADLSQPNSKIKKSLDSGLKELNKIKIDDVLVHPVTGKVCLVIRKDYGSLTITDGDFVYTMNGLCGYVKFNQDEDEQCVH